ncbi:MAG: HNH endonuclease [Gammaproteobacteria bacterium]|nr:MAG: HNH endonuclease [Gammaproteobacteria bacterium]
MIVESCVSEGKVCIWCLRIEGQVNFKTKAHIFPDSLGGKRMCQDECDECNNYFGSKQNGLPSVDIAFKEVLNISRYFLQSNMNLPFQKKSRFKSEYFDLDKRTNVIKPLFKYSNLKSFQDNFVKQFARGIYKVFLAERQKSRRDALKSEYDFIRAFARYGIGNLPIFYCRPNIPAIAVSDDVIKPVIRFTEYSDYTMSDFGFYSYDFMTHTFVFPTINNYEICFESFVQHLKEKDTYESIKKVTRVSDIDLLFTYALGKDNERSRRWG